MRESAAQPGINADGAIAPMIRGAICLISSCSDDNDRSKTIGLKHLR